MTLALQVHKPYDILQTYLHHKKLSTMNIGTSPFFPFPVISQDMVRTNAALTRADSAFLQFWKLMQIIKTLRNPIPILLLQL